MHYELCIISPSFLGVFTRMITWSKPYSMQLLTVVNTFSTLISKKYFFSFVIPPFHLGTITTLIIRGLCEVELWVELWWNYMKFHPNSTPNSTSSNILITKYITHPRWKGGITFAKINFLRIIAEKL